MDRKQRNINRLKINRNMNDLENKSEETRRMVIDNIKSLFDEMGVLNDMCNVIAQIEKEYTLKLALEFLGSLENSYSKTHGNDDDSVELQTSTDDYDKHTHWFSLADGSEMFIPYKWMQKIDFECGRVYPNSRHDDGMPLPDLNDLKREGLLEAKYPYRQFEVYPEDGQSLEGVLLSFKSEGFNVTREAIAHNYEAWSMDMKSGYRDEKNGYHLFTPCGCNPLSFRLSTLHPIAEDWQRTYIC